MSDPNTGWLERVMARIRRAAHPDSPAIEDLPDEPEPILHWSNDHLPYPACGARVGEPYTIEPEAATCPKCKEIALPIVMQYNATTR